MMLYTWKVRFLKTQWGNRFWRSWQAWRGDDIGSYSRLPEYIRKYAPGSTFADIGCMWGVNGEYAFTAEEAGATTVKGVDVFGPTPEFEAKRKARNSSVEFILGDAGHPDTIAKVGVVDVILCAGVLYYQPSPFDLLRGSTAYVPEDIDPTYLNNSRDQWIAECRGLLSNAQFEGPAIMRVYPVWG